MVSELTERSMIHSSSILHSSHTDIQLSQHHLLKNILSPLDFLALMSGTATFIFKVLFCIVCCMTLSIASFVQKRITLVVVTETTCLVKSECLLPDHAQKEKSRSLFNGPFCDPLHVRGHLTMNSTMKNKRN